MSIVRLTASDGRPAEFVDQVRASGGMKDVYFSPSEKYVVAFYRSPLDEASRERLAAITGPYRERIFNQAGGDYWRGSFCWPTATVEYQGRTGVVVPFYEANFFFAQGSRNNDMLGIKGREKESKWFTSASNRARFLEPQELGNWLSQLRVCLSLARAVRRLHAAGLAHSDLSYKNVLIDPLTGRACLIDLDGLVVPGKFAPEVVGTPDFIAPEVVASQHLSKGDPARKLPSISTDLHALATLIYMYLLVRHPLRGDCSHHEDPVQDELLAMGERALFIEHPSNSANRVNPANLKAYELPWKNPAQTPYSLTGPYLSQLFERAFIDGLHNPHARPGADEWEIALVKTLDLIQPCTNTACPQAWYVFDNSRSPACPFCHTPYKGTLPVLNLYSTRGEGSFRPDNHRLMVYSNQSLFPWHTNREIFPNEKLTPEQKQRQGYFVLHEGQWWLVNEGLPELLLANSQTPIPIGERIALADGQQLLFSKQKGGRLAVVQMVSGV
jgi:serine/threonine protein kinase